MKIIPDYDPFFENEEIFFFARNKIESFQS